jgi:hypothetical protein
MPFYLSTGVQAKIDIPYTATCPFGKFAILHDVLNSRIRFAACRRRRDGLVSISHFRISATSLLLTSERCCLENYAFSSTIPLLPPPHSYRSLEPFPLLQRPNLSTLRDLYSTLLNLFPDNISHRIHHSSPIGVPCWVIFVQTSGDLGWTYR